MEQTLPDIIRQNEELRRTLLAQEGGIMRFWAQHPEKDFDADLFEDYERSIDEAYRQAYNQSRTVARLSPDELRERALVWYYQNKVTELRFFGSIKPMTDKLGEEVTQQVLEHIERYMQDAYTESRRRKYPNGISPLDFYNEVIEKYGPTGLALECLEAVLQECRGKTVHLTIKHFFRPHNSPQEDSMVWDEIYRLETEFNIRMFLNGYRGKGFRMLRQAVKEMIDKATQDMTGEVRRKTCRQIAIEEIRKVNQFTRWVNNETCPMRVATVREDENGEIVEEAEKGGPVPLISPEERHWLRNIEYENSPGATGKQKLTTMQKHYTRFVDILQDLGRIWAAQLLVHGIDMKDLEKETGVILSIVPNLMYYVDGLTGDTRGDCCVFDERQAKELLEALQGQKGGEVLPSQNEGLQDKEKAQRLWATNTIIKLSGDEEQQKKELMRLYTFIKNRFVQDIKNKYEWYALRRFLNKYNLLKDCDNEQFANQMNNKEWFGYLEEKYQCSAYSMNTYNYLNDVESSQQWVDKEIPGGSRATRKAVTFIYKSYENLVLYQVEIMNK